MQEHFSIAWVRALAAAAGCNPTPKGEFDHDSVDGGFSFRTTGGALGEIDSPRFEYQLKCQLGPLTPGAADFPYALSRKNYDDLRSQNLQVPRILIVVIVPPDPGQWVGHLSHQRIDLSHAAYWFSLYGHPRTTSASKTVRIPTDQEFTIAALHQMIQLIGAGAESL